MRFQRLTQIFCLFVFLLLLTAAITGTFTTVVQDFFLRLDPVLVFTTAISARDFKLIFIPAVAILAVTLLFGRIFCGHICPMGTTLDGSDSLFAKSYKKQKKFSNIRPLKYLVLLFIFTSGLFSISLVFIASPLSLITRFYGLLIQPILALILNKVLLLISPVFDWFDFNTLLFLHIDTPRFSTQVFISIFFITLFASARITPRFWCRYLCPAGAILALFSIKPLIQRRVTDNCTDCGKCVRFCPMDAIPKDQPLATRHEECIVCMLCEEVCPEECVSFGLGQSKPVMDKPAFLPARRQIIISGLAGVGTAALSYTGLHSLYGDPGEGHVLPPMLIRPPAALPEVDFLSQCVRCGECMAACPTNTLQPDWFKSGFSGLFSPTIVTRRGYCDPECHRCADVCPTEAIRKLPASERIWAKTGTATILRNRCLAWEHDKECMVCDEVCPFDAIIFEKEMGIPVTVPRVKEDKCSGCGYCEYYCPAQHRSAIVVTPMSAIRLSKGSFKEQGKRQGLNISLKTKEKQVGYPLKEPASTEGTAPGFTD